MLAIVLYVLAIVVCGGAGAAAGWWLSGAAGLTGTVGAIVSAIVAMIVAVALWAGGVVVANRLQR